MRNTVSKSFAMILQVSITMLVPIVLCICLAVWLNNCFDVVWFMPVFLFLGCGAGIRNVYILLKSYTQNEDNLENRTNSEIRRLKSEGQKKNGKRKIS